MSKKFLAPALAVVIIAGLAVSIGKLWRYSPYSVTRDLIGNPRVVLSLRDVEFAGRSQGKRIWSFRADRVDISRGRLKTSVEGVRDGRIYDQGRLVAKVTAGNAVYDAFNQNVEVSHGVELEAVQGFKASTDKALWSSYGRRLICPGKVEFSSGAGKLVGNNLVADVRLGDVTLENGKMQVVVDDLEKLGTGAGKTAPGTKQ